MPLVYSFAAPPNVRFTCPVQCGQCTATAANGQRCRKRTCVGVPMCWMHLMRESNLRIKASTLSGAGRGLFAVKRGAADTEVLFKKGDTVAPYGGELLTEREVDARYGANFTAPYAIKLRGDRFENGACVRGPGSMVNHVPARLANAEFRLTRDNRSRLVALKRIYNGQEVLVSYGSDYRLDEPTTSRTVRRR